MKVFIRVMDVLILALFLFGSCGMFLPDDLPDPDGSGSELALIVDHTNTSISAVPTSAIQAAKSSLSVYYGHTSHGSQLLSGMDGLDAFKGGTGLYTWNADGSGGALGIVETWSDAGYYPEWYNLTTDYLGVANGAGRGSAHPAVNVVMWSWCGQLSWMSAGELQSGYLDPMARLEDTYPGIAFVHFTGHLDGTGTAGTLHHNNETIRAWCAARGCWLYDFADIECHDPAGNSYLARNQDDACNYDADGDGSPDSNWAEAWQAANPGDWYPCDPAHAESADVMGNRKAYAAWYLFARLAGWEG